MGASPSVHRSKSVQDHSPYRKTSVTHSSSGVDSCLTPPFMPLLAKGLCDASVQSGGTERGIYRATFVKMVFPRTPDFGSRIFTYLMKLCNNKTGVLSEKQFVQAVDSKFQATFQADNVHFYLMLYAETGDLSVMSLENFEEFLTVTYEISSGLIRTGSEVEKNVINAMVTSAFHKKLEASVGYLQGWIMKNCPHMVTHLSKYVVKRISTAHCSFSGDCNAVEVYPELPVVMRDDVKEEFSAENAYKTFHPMFIWAMASCLPLSYSKPTESPVGIKFYQSLSDLLTNLSVPRKWQVLYDTDENGLAMNRFMHHVMKYRGPTIMYIQADSDYKFCLGVDEEWKDAGSYWGGGGCLAAEITPEFHVLESGAKMYCFNSCIRGYPIGLSVGSDPRQPLIRMDQSWNKLEFKKIPLSIVRIVVVGAGEAKLVETQEKLRKARDDYAVSRRAVDRKKLLEDYDIDRGILSLGSTPANYDSDQFRRPAPE